MADDLSKEWEQAEPLETEWDTAEPITNTQAPTSKNNQPDPMPNFLDRLTNQAKGDLYEPFRIASETASQLANLPVKAYKGLTGLAATGGALAGGASLDEALQEGTNQIGNRNLITSPLEQSRISKFIGNDIGKETNMLGRITGQPELVQGAVEAGGDIASLLAMNPSAKIAKSAAKSALGVLPEQDIYGSAVKLPLAKKWVKDLPGKEINRRQNAINAGMNEGILPNELGLNQAKTLVDKTTKLANDTVSAYDGLGHAIAWEDLKDKALSYARSIALKSKPEILNKYIDKVWRDFMKGRPEVAEPSVLQSVKQQKYTEANYAASSANKSALTQVREAINKGIARAAKEHLESISPDIKNINSKLSSYIDLHDALETAVPRIQNANLVGLGTKVLARGNPLMAIANHILGLPTLKARTAISLGRLKGMKPAELPSPPQTYPRKPPIVEPYPGAGKINTLNLPVGPTPEPPMPKRIPLNLPVGETTYFDKLIGARTNKDPLGIR